jgi:hypothetical protein
MYLHRFGIVVALLTALSGLSGCKHGDVCERAWDHMNDLSTTELEKTPGVSAADIEAAKNANPEGRDKFIGACHAKKVDPECVLAAKNTFGYTACIARMH